MTDKQIEIGDSILKLFAENDWRLNDVHLYKMMNNLYGCEESIVRPVYTILIDDYKLLRRNPKNGMFKHLTDKGYDVTKNGLKKHLRWIRYNELFNGLVSRILQFVIPLSIAVIALITDCSDKKLDNYYSKTQIDSIFKDKETINTKVYLEHEQKSQFRQKRK